MEEPRITPGAIIGLRGWGHASEKQTTKGAEVEEEGILIYVFRVWVICVANQMVMVAEMPVWTSGRKPLLETWI